MTYATRFVGFLLLCAGACAAQANTIKKLIATQELEARIIVETPAPLFQKAPIIISVEVGTPHTFKAGIRVRDFTIPGALVRATAKYPINETRRHGDETWAIQSLRFRLYSDRAGSLDAPDLMAFISVETEAHGVVEGELQLQAPAIEVEVPPGVEGLDSWIAATDFKTDESWEGILERYQIGDAITRTRRFTINGVPAMAIPASPELQLDGIQTYQAPALIDDKTVGRSLTGIRQERAVFTIKAGGSYTIPAHRLHWFNLETQSIEYIDFPSRTLEAEGASQSKSPFELELKGSKTLVLMSGGVALVIGALYLLYRALGRNWFSYPLGKIKLWKRHRRLKLEFMRAADEQNSILCLRLIYDRMSGNKEQQLTSLFAQDKELVAISTALMGHAYGNEKPPEPYQIKTLWNACKVNKKKQKVFSQLRLNPKPSH